MFRFGRVAVSVSCLICLSGCFNAKQDFTFTEDGKAQMDLTIAVEASALAMMGGNSDSRQFCTVPARVGDVPSLSVQMDRSTDGSQEICRVVAAAQIDDIPAIMEKLDTGTTDQNKLRITVQQEGARYRFRLAFTGVPNQQEKDDNPFAQAAKTMMLASLVNRSLEWSVTAPQIIETTARLSADGNTTVYSVPLASLVSDGDRAYGFEVLFSLKQPSMWDWITGLFD